MRDHVEEDLVAIGDEQRPAAHASSLRRASTSSRRGDVQRLRRGDQVRLMRLEEGEDRGEQAGLADPLAQRRRIEAGQGEQPLRARLVAQRPAERGQRQSLGIGRVCVVAPHLLQVRRWDKKSSLSRTTNSI